MSRRFVLVFVALWTIPTLGILVSSLRDRDQIIVSGWWEALTTSSQTDAGRLAGGEEEVERDGQFVIEGNMLEEGDSRAITRFGVTVREPTAYEAGTVAELDDGDEAVAARAVVLPRSVVRPGAERGERSPVGVVPLLRFRTPARGDGVLRAGAGRGAEKERDDGECLLAARCAHAHIPGW